MKRKILLSSLLTSPAALEAKSNTFAVAINIEVSFGKVQDRAEICTYIHLPSLPSDRPICAQSHFANFLWQSGQSYRRRVPATGTNLRYRTRVHPCHVAGAMWSNLACSHCVRVVVHGLAGNRFGTSLNYLSNFPRLTFKFSLRVSLHLYI